MKVLEIVKKHPVATGVGVFAIGLILVLALAGGSSGESNSGTVAVQPVNNNGGGAYDAQVALGTIQGQVAAYSIDAQKAVALDTNATDLAKTRAAIEMTNNANILGAAVATHGQDISFHIAAAQANRDINIATINSNAAVAINGQNVGGMLAINAQNVAQENNNVQWLAAIEREKTLSAERIAGMTVGTQGAIAAASIASNERIQFGAQGSNERIQTGAQNSNERLGAASLANTSFVEVSKIGSNERLGAAALQMGAFGSINVNSSVGGVAVAGR